MKNQSIDYSLPGLATGTLGKVFKSITTMGTTEQNELVRATLEYINLHKPHHMYVKVQLEGNNLSTPFFVGEVFKSVTKTSRVIVFDGQEFRFNLGEEPSLSFAKDILYTIVPKLEKIVLKAQTHKGKKRDVFVKFS